jgi:hypothetical protein
MSNNDDGPERWRRRVAVIVIVAIIVAVVMIRAVLERDLALTLEMCQVDGRWVPMRPSIFSS